MSVCLLDLTDLENPWLLLPVPEKGVLEKGYKTLLFDRTFSTLNSSNTV